MCVMSISKKEIQLTGELGFELVSFYESALMVVRASRMRYSQYLDDEFRIDAG